MAQYLSSSLKTNDWPEFAQRSDRFLRTLPLASCDGCDGCGQRCGAGFRVTREEALAAFAAFASLSADEQRFVDEQPREQPWPGVDPETLTFVRCRYRDAERGRCAIYPARPTVCRFFGHVDWLPCPIGEVDPVSEPARSLWREYVELERRTWEEWEAEGVDPSGGTAVPSVADGQPPLA
ncbi:MAG: YkgJ family cysteine cluster protein [Armatimonadota bacterium]